MSRPVLVLRPQPEADETARWLRARGHEPIVSPLLAPAPGDPPPEEGGFDAVVATSPRALPALKALNRLDLPLFVVGERCAALAREAGWSVAAVAGDASGLVAPLTAALAAVTHVLHAAPAQRAFDLEAALRDRGIRCTTWCAYRMEERPLTAAARAALEGETSVLLTSPRIASAFGRAWRDLRAAQPDLPVPRALAISPNAAAALEPFEGAVHLADPPTLAALLERV